MYHQKKFYAFLFENWFVLFETVGHQYELYLTAKLHQIRWIEVEPTNWFALQINNELFRFENEEKTVWEEFFTVQFRAEAHW